MSPINLAYEIKYKNRQFTRTFDFEMYNKHKWLIRCKMKNVLFCFQRLLTGEDMWMKTGMTDAHDRCPLLSRQYTEAWKFSMPHE